jgi:hypothetical protein
MPAVRQISGEDPPLQTLRLHLGQYSQPLLEMWT